MKRVLPILIIATSCLGSAQIAKKGAGYLFRTNYKKGQVMKFQMNTVANVPGMPQPMRMTSPIVMAIKAVANNVATVDVTTGPAMMNGKSQGAVDKRTVKMDNRNRPVGGESNYEGFSSFEFPANPVTPGSVWSGKTKLDTAMGSLALDAKYKFVGIKKVNGKTVAEIVTTFTGVMMGPVKGTATTHLLVNDGSLYSVIAKMTTEVKTSAEAQAMKVATDISVKRT